MAAARLVEAEVEHLDDVGVDEPRRRQGLAAEAGDERRIVGQVLGEELDGHRALEPLVEGQLDRGHAAHAEAALEPVAAGDPLLAHGACVPPPLPGGAPVPPPPPPPPLLPPPVSVGCVSVGCVSVGVVVSVLCVLSVVAVVSVLCVLSVVAVVLFWVHSRAAAIRSFS